jgi:hypothetical protein
MLPYEFRLVLAVLVAVTTSVLFLFWWFLGWVERTAREGPSTRAECRSRACQLLHL